MTCVVTVSGALRDCVVVDESPAGMGFGAAALLLAPSFHMKPATKAGRPVESAVTIPVQWQRQTASGGERYTVTANWPWAQAPSWGQVDAAYPSRARDKGIAGRALLRCSLKPDGRLKDCGVLDETPGNMGFGPAALSLSRLFQAPAPTEDPRTLSQLRINLSFQFAPRGSTTPYLTRLDWTKELQADAVFEAFPAKAADAGLTTGRATVDCAVAATGALVNCATVNEDPVDMDFGATAPKIAEQLAINPWTEDGLPAEGAHVKFAIRFNKAGGPGTPRGR